MSKLCVVIGAGPGNGFHFAKRFAEGGYDVAMIARNEEKLQALAKQIDNAHAFAADVGDAMALTRALTEIRAELGTVDILLYNAGAAAFGSIDELDLDVFEAAWRTNVAGCVTAVKAVLADMRSAGGGSIVITGATASLKGGAKFAAFAAAKGAQRNLAQSLARHLGPDNIHVAYMIIDGVVNLTPTRTGMFADKPDDFFLEPADIAEQVWQVAHQPKSCRTFEFDVRPYAEKW